MVVTALSLIQKAWKDCGLQKMDQLPPQNAIADAIIDLNMLIDSWGIQKGMAMADITESFTLKAGKYLYQIGPTALTVNGDFQTDKPWAITSAYIQDQMNNRYDVGITDKVLWQTYEDALITSTRPTELVYDPGPTQQTNQVGTVIMYPIPDALLTYTLFLVQQKPFTEFSGQNDQVQFPSAYYLALRYNLAIMLWPQYRDDGAPVAKWLAGQASKWQRKIIAMNAKAGISQIEIGRKKGKSSYDIFQGPYSGGG
jgi:hypothetical protein